MRNGSLKYAPDDAINPLRPVEADSTTLIYFRLVHATRSVPRVWKGTDGARRERITSNVRGCFSNFINAFPRTDDSRLGFGLHMPTPKGGPGYARRGFFRCGISPFSNQSPPESDRWGVLSEPPANREAPTFAVGASFRLGSLISGLV